MQPLTWIQIAGSVIAIIATAAFISTLVAVGAALARNWVLLKKCGIAAVVAIAGLILTFGLLLSAIASLDPDTARESKAAVLARGMSQGMQASIALLALGLVVMSGWWIAKRRARK